jgi:hypothetical protein
LPHELELMTNDHAKEREAGKNCDTSTKKAYDK